MQNKNNENPFAALLEMHKQQEKELMGQLKFILIGCVLLLSGITMIVLAGHSWVAVGVLSMLIGYPLATKLL